MSDVSYQPDLLSTFAHDLRQPLRNIVIQAQLIQRQDAALSEDTKSRLQEIVTAGRKQDELISSVMEYDQAEQAALDQTNPLPLKLAIQTACLKIDAYRRQCEGTIQFDTVSAPMFPVPAVLSKVIEKVLHNALKFRRPGSQPAVEIEAYGDPTGECVIRIMDDGLGIEPQYRSIVFEPFRKLNSPVDYPGSGMGLAIGDRIVRAIGGRIAAEDVPSKREGVAIVITFPLP